jgi:hypothetical protein
MMHVGYRRRTWSSFWDDHRPHFRVFERFDSEYYEFDAVMMVPNAVGPDQWSTE